MTAIQGHDKEIAAFLSAIRGERPHHGWLFAGPEGLGKAKAARMLGARILAEASDPLLNRSDTPLPAEHGTNRLIEAGSHPDFKWVAREVWQKNTNPPRLVPYDERKPDEAPSRSIRVAQIRWLGDALTLSPSLSSRRVIVIDSADDLEPSAANALLKMLEEPPQGTFFLLISHSPGRILPTIRSRCRILRFSSLSDDVMTSVLRESLPDADPDDVAKLVEAGQGSPGRALALANAGATELLKSLERIAATGDPENRERSQLSQALATKAAQHRFEAFLRLVPAFLAAQSRGRSGAALAEALQHWEKARDLAGHAIPGSLEPQAVAFALATHVAALAPARENVKA